MVDTLTVSELLEGVFVCGSFFFRFLSQALIAAVILFQHFGIFLNYNFIKLLKNVVCFFF